MEWDIAVVGAGTAGLMTAIFASRRGARVLVLEVAPEIGGALHVSSGRMSAAGTRFQIENHIVDTPDEHYEDVMRICHDTADPALVRLAVDKAAETFDWVHERGFPLATDAPVLGTGLHEAYTKERYAWGVEHGRSILKAIAPAFWAQIASGNVTLKLGHRATALLRDNDGAVVGVEATGPDGSTYGYRATNVVIASGGFGASPELMSALHKTPLYSIGCYRHCKGDGLKMAMEAGATVRGQDYYHANFGAILASYDYPADVIATAQTIPQFRQPWEIYVDSNGRRFVNECEPSIDARERALVALPDRRYWIVFDEAILRDAPPMINTWTREDIRGAFDQHPMFVSAPTVAELAAKTGMDPIALSASVDAYNAGRSGNDPLGRDHRPAPIVEGPFYAIRQHCTVIVTTAGIVVDAGLRVLDPEGAPIAGLYAAGEVLGSVATMGDAAANGMLVTPALAFGRMLGEEILRWPERNATPVLARSLG